MKDPILTNNWRVLLGHQFFKFRGYSPIPFLILALWVAFPTPTSWLIGFFFVLIGEGIRILGVAFAGATTRTRNVIAKNLVTNGPFAFVRNPLYIGNLVLSGGLLIIANGFFPWLLLVYFSSFIVQYYFIVLFEESHLAENCGELYLKFFKEVPRFIPRLTPFPSRQGPKPNYRVAIKSEKDTLFAILAIIAIIFVTMLFRR